MELFEALLLEAYELLETNPWFLTPPPDMEKRRRALVGRRPKAPRKAGRLRIPRPKTRKKRRLTVKQRLVARLQKARRAKDESAFRYWSKVLARRSKRP